MIDVAILDIGPVSHIELLIHCELPFISPATNTASVSVRAHVFSVQSVTLRLLIEKFLSADGLGIDISADDTLAETLVRADGV